MRFRPAWLFKRSRPEGPILFLKRFGPARLSKAEPGRMAYKWVRLCSAPASPPWLEHKRRRSYRPREKNRFGKQCNASVWRKPNNFRIRGKKIAFQLKNHWEILHNFLSRPSGKNQKNAEFPNWWRCRDSHSGPTITCRSHYRLIPEFVSDRPGSGRQSRSKAPCCLLPANTKRDARAAPYVLTLTLRYRDAHGSEAHLGVGPGQLI